MAMTRTDCMQILKRAGASDTDAQLIITEMLEQRARLKAAAPDGKASPQDLAHAWEITAEAVARQVAAQRRRIALGLLRFAEARDFVASVKARGFSAMDGIQALLVGISKPFDGARHSVSALRQGIFTSWVAPMLRELEAVDQGAALRLMREDKVFHDDVFREMREPNSAGNPSARAIADIFSRYLEQSRIRLNAAGADIDELDGRTPQAHDPYKLLAGGAAGRERWIDFMLPRLDLERTLPDAGLVDEKRAREMLDNVYETLILGKNPHLPGDITGGGADGSGPANLAERLSGRQRVLHFKDAQGALDYHHAYGRGTILDAMLGQLEQDARALAILERLGPNPRCTLERLVAHEKRALRDNAALSPEEKARRAEDLDKAISGGVDCQGEVALWLAQLSGESNGAVNPTVARVGAVLRASQALSGLGGATLSTISDVFIRAASMRVNGQTWPEALGRSMARHFQDHGEEPREVARQCAALLDQVRGDILARWDHAAHMPGMQAHLQDRLLRWSGPDWIRESGKAGYTLWLSEYLGEACGKAFDQLDGQRRAMLRYHGMDAARWEVMRKMSRRAEDGKVYFTPEAAANLTDAELAPLLSAHPRRVDPQAGACDLASLRESLRFASMVMLADETAFAVMGPDEAIGAPMRATARPVTAAGEFWRAVMQFKSFPWACMRRAACDLPGTEKDARGRNMGGLTGMVLSCVALGYAAMALKDLAGGRRPPNPARKEIWLAACVRSGGLGILADFLLGKARRFGHSFAQSAAGSLGATTGQALTMGGQSASGELADAQDRPADKDALGLALNNASFINLWYTRAALDWLLLLHVREMLLPGALRRTERKLKKQFGQGNVIPLSRLCAYGRDTSEEALDMRPEQTGVM